MGTVSCGRIVPREISAVTNFQTRMKSWKKGAVVLYNPHTQKRGAAFKYSHTKKRGGMFKSISCPDTLKYYTPIQLFRHTSMINSTNKTNTITTLYIKERQATQMFSDEEKKHTKLTRRTSNLVWPPQKVPRNLHVRILQLPTD
jgi:hypothetical protein